MSKEQAKFKIKELIAQAECLIPETLQENLPGMDEMPGIPKWHEYEHKIWELGERIRHELVIHKSLHKDKEILDDLLKISLNRNAKRGRQSFIMLFWYKHCREYAPQLVTQIGDEFVSGHIIKGLNKMHADEFVEPVKNFLDHKITWVRNEAKKYLVTYRK